MELFKQILTNVLTSLYQPFLPALLLTFIVSLAYLYYLYCTDPVGAGAMLRS